MSRRISEQAYYDRLKQLANVDNNTNNKHKTNSLGTLINYKKGSDGIAYGIVKENHNYYIKKGNTNENQNVSDFAYIGGLSNITNYQYNSLAEADKNRNMLFKTINESSKFKTNKTSSKLVLNENETEKEIEMASSKIDDLENATDAAISEPNIPEPEGDDVPNIPEPEGDDVPDMTEPEGDDVPDMTEPEGDEETIDNDDLITSDIEKKLGKLTNSIRKTDLEPSQIKSYINSFLSAFKDKIKDVEIEDRKEMADKILKIVSTDDIDDLSDNVEKTDSDDDLDETNKCSECGSFAQYAESRGYDVNSIVECGDDEMSSLVGGYANAFNEGLNDGDFKDVALYTNENVLNSLSQEYGHEDYAENLQEYVDNLAECGNDDRLSKIKESWSAIKDPSNIEVQPNVVSENEEEDEDIVNSINIDDEKPLDNDVNDTSDDETIDFAPNGDSIGGGLPKPDSSEDNLVNIDVDGQNKTVNIKMSESEIKIRKYIHNKLLEFSGKKKPSLNENKKSDKLKSFDETIKKIYESELKKNIKNDAENIDEFFGSNLKQKFEKLDPNNDTDVDKLFKSVFGNYFIGRYKGAYVIAERNTNTQEKYNILKQYVNNNKKGGLKTTSDKKLEYTENPPLKQGGAISGTAGFNAGY